MRKVLVLLLALSALGLTTAVAADFDVQTEDITSFSTAVSIPLPEQRVFYLIGDPDTLPGVLSSTPESETQSVESKNLQPGGLLATAPDAFGVSYQAPEARTTHKHDWVTPTTLGSPLSIDSPIVRLYITETAQAAELTAGLFDCTADLSTCRLIARATASPVQNEVQMDFGTFQYTIPETNRLYVRIVNSDDNPTKIQWGYKQNRPARLELNVQS